MADALLVHDVYFTLKDRSPAARQRLVDACRQYLPKHDGIVFFACGVLAEALDRDVNDRDWDVGLHIVFRDQAAHDVYQESAPHNQFIDENQATWASVRVFDTIAGQTPTS
ncbi:MAG: Dabb family protein [Gemmataceae bacterium]